MRSTCPGPATRSPRPRMLLAAAACCALSIGACEKLPEAPNQPPNASFVYSPVSPIVAGESVVAFNGSASTDSDGSVATYAWDFGDGTAAQSSSSPTIGHVFPDTANTCMEMVYTVQLTVTDDQGDKGFASAQVRVTELPWPNSAECQQPQQ